MARPKVTTRWRSITISEGGKPSVKGRNIETAAIAARFRAGESVEELADDYSVWADYIEDALRWEMMTKQKRAKIAAAGGEGA